MKYLKTFQQINEAATKKTTDYAKKFAKRIEEISKLIEKAKEDEIWAVETDSTVETEYEFQEIKIEKNKLKLTYKENLWTKPKTTTDTINLTKDEENNFDEAKYIFSWVKKCIKKGYKKSEKNEKE
jgi:hypothetical protein